MGNKIEVSFSCNARQDTLLTRFYREPRRRPSSHPPSSARRRRTEWPAASVVRKSSPTRRTRLIALCDSIQIDEWSLKWHGRSYDTVTSDFRSSDLIMVYFQTRFCARDFGSAGIAKHHRAFLHHQQYTTILWDTAIVDLCML